MIRDLLARENGLTDVASVIINSTGVPEASVCQRGCTGSVCSQAHVVPSARLWFAVTLSFHAFHHGGAVPAAAAPSTHLASCQHLRRAFPGTGLSATLFIACQIITQIYS